jgi:hypothetical protein
MKDHGSALATGLSSPAGQNEQDKLSSLLEAYATGGEDALRRAFSELHPDLELKKSAAA